MRINQDRLLIKQIIKGKNKQYTLHDMIAKNPYNIEYIPDEYNSEDLCLEAVKGDTTTIIDIPSRCEWLRPALTIEPALW